MPKVSIVVGTRPNFIKVTQFKEQAAHFPGLSIEIVHTGQHFDANMAGVFFDQFRLRPDVFLDVEPATPVAQIAAIIEALGQHFSVNRPDLIIAVGDVNSTLCAALVANKMGIALAHLESGLRSFDRSMPEEHNRVITDQLADLYFVTEPSGMENLRREGMAGVPHLVGNTMIDTLVAFEPEIEADPVLEQHGLASGDYILTTIHRPATVDSREGLTQLLELLKLLTAMKRLVFPVHPRTVKNFLDFGLWQAVEMMPGLVLLEPQGYFAFQKLIAHSAWVLTDSGGIQEETTFRQKPCLTLRPNTERPVTVTAGTNTLVAFDLPHIAALAASIHEGTYKTGNIPHLWDGHATGRVLQIVRDFLS